MPTPISPAEKALKCYKADWDQAAEKLQKRYPNLQMDEAFRTKATDFLTYITYLRTEYFKMFALRQAFSEDAIAVKEAEMLQFVGIDGFKALLNKGKYWELLDDVVKRAYPDAELLAPKLSEHELKLTEQHREELLSKDQEITKLQGDIRRMEEEVEKEKEKVESLRRDFDNKKAELAGKLEEETKRADDAKRTLEEERSRLKEFTSKMVVVEGELKRTEEESASMRRRHREDISKAYQAVERKESELATKEGQIVNLQSELTRTKLAATTLEQEKAILQSRYDEDKSELESRRREARAFDLKHAQLGVTLDKASKDADNLAIRIGVAALVNTNLNIREGGLAAREAELAASQTHFDLLVQEERRRIRAEVEAELDARFKAVEPLEKLMAEVARKEKMIKEREEQCSYLLEEILEKTTEIVLAKEQLFAERADGTHRTIINEFASLHRAIDEKALIPIPSGIIDDAKKGEGRSEGKLT